MSLLHINTSHQSASPILSPSPVSLLILVSSLLSRFHRLCISSSGTMSIIFEDHELAPIYPIAPRMREGLKKPHVGPSRKDYEGLHSKTVGEDSDEWWGNVSTV